MRSTPLLPLVAALVLLAPLPAGAQEGGAPPAAGGAAPAPVPAPTPPEVSADDVESTPADDAEPRPTDAPTGEASLAIAFLGVHAGPEDAEVGFIVEERVRAALEAPPFVLADAPSAPLPPDCLESDACRLERIAAAGSPWVVVGTLGRADSSGTEELVLTLHLVSRTTGLREARASAWAPAAEAGAAGLLASIEPAVAALVQTIDPGAVPPVPVDLDLAGPVDDEDDDDGDIPEPEDESRTRMWPDEELEGQGPRTADGAKRLEAAASAPASAAKAPAEASSGINYGAWVWSGSFVAAGTAAALVGVGFDLLSPTSVNDELDVFDAVGPGLVVVGATVALAGLVVNPFLWLDTEEGTAAEGGEANAR